MKSSKRLQDYLKERDKAFESGNLDWARNQLGPDTPQATVEMAFHKARYECTSVSDEKRYESQTWLIRNNVRRLNGQFARPGHHLPKGPSR